MLSRNKKCLEIIQFILRYSKPPSKEFREDNRILSQPEMNGDNFPCSELRGWSLRNRTDRIAKSSWPWETPRTAFLWNVSAECKRRRRTMTVLNTGDATCATHTHTPRCGMMWCAQKAQMQAV